MTLLKFPDRRQHAVERGSTLVQPAKQYLSTEEVAQWLGLSIRTITALAAQWYDSDGVEGIPAFKLGRSWRFDRLKIQAYIDAKQLPFQRSG
jgi:excisionase family DNA binding protein